MMTSQCLMVFLFSCTFLSVVVANNLESRIYQQYLLQRSRLCPSILKEPYWATISDAVLRGNLTTRDVFTMVELMGTDVGNIVESNRSLNFPFDHLMHPPQNIEWFYLVTILHIEGIPNGRVGVMSIPMRRRAFSLQFAQENGYDMNDAAILDHSFTLTVELPSGSYRMQRPINVLWGLMDDLVVPTWPPYGLKMGTDTYFGAVNDIFPLHTYTTWPGVTVDLTHTATQPYFLQAGTGWLPPFLYYSMPQIQTHGYVTVNNDTYTVTGRSWLDHQWGANPSVCPRPGLINNDKGWIWFQFNFDDNSSFTAFATHDNIENYSNLPSSFANSLGQYIIPIPGQQSLNVLCNFSADVTHFTKSAIAGAYYPNDLTMSCVGLFIPINLALTVTSWMPDQSILWASSMEYSEGPCDAVGTITVAGVPQSIKGEGFCEGVGWELKSTEFDRMVASLDHDDNKNCD